MAIMKDNANVNWSSILSGMFNDPRFRRLSNWCWYAEIEGMKVGVVLATRNPGYATFALNKNDVDRLLAGKRSGKLDHAFLVGTSVDPLNNHVYCNFKDAASFYEQELTKLRPRDGKYGDFWTLTQFANIADLDDVPY
jgi:hypothetical protein